MNEKEIERLITEYVWADRDDAQDFILGVDRAAHAIAEKLAEGVVWSSEGRWFKDSLGNQILAITKPEFEVWLLSPGVPNDEGQRAWLTVTKEE